VELGYLEDPFAEVFVTTPKPGNARRLPIINRGTYTRTAALDKIIEAFLFPGEHNPGSSVRQIISLGAGTDTRAFRLFSRPDVHNLNYHEIDFQQVSSKKLGTVQTTIKIRDVLPEVKVDEFLDSGISVWTAHDSGNNQLHGHGVDLRRLAQSAGKAESAEISELRAVNTDVPTLLLSECCLCYLEAEEAAGVIQWFTERIPNLAIVIYEPTRSDDPFGRQMVSNLAARNIRMPSLDHLKEPADQEQRLRTAGLQRVRQKTVDHVWEEWISEEEKERVDSLEGLDEVEEWKLLAGHYVIAWGSKGAGFDRVGELN
jgi:[phosphatase 2A protein]-leucine-carboxy methyltransferase